MSLIEGSGRSQDRLVVCDTVPQPADILQAAMDDGPGKLNSRERAAQTRLPRCPVISLGSQVRPEAKHEFGDNFARRGVGANCIADGVSDFVLRIGRQRSDCVPARHPEMSSKQIMHAVADGDLKPMEQAERHLRHRNVLLVERDASSRLWSLAARYRFSRSRETRHSISVSIAGAWGNGVLRRAVLKINLRLLGASLPQGIFPGQKKKGASNGPFFFCATRYRGSSQRFCK